MWEEGKKEPGHSNSHFTMDYILASRFLQDGWTTTAQYRLKSEKMAIWRSLSLFSSNAKINVF